MHDSHQHSDSSTLHHSLGTVQQQDGLHKRRLHAEQEQIEAARVAEWLAAEVAQADSHCHSPLSCQRQRLMWVSAHQRACKARNTLETGGRPSKAD